VGHATYVPGQSGTDSQLKGFSVVERFRHVVAIPGSKWNFRVDEVRPMDSVDLALFLGH